MTRNSTFVSRAGAALSLVTVHGRVDSVKVFRVHASSRQRATRSPHLFASRTLFQPVQHFSPDCAISAMSSTCRLGSAAQDAPTHSTRAGRSISFGSCTVRQGSLPRALRSKKAQAISIMALTVYCNNMAARADDHVFSLASRSGELYSSRRQEPFAGSATIGNLSAPLNTVGILYLGFFFQ